jgi:maltose O-acetyltransferase
MNRVVQDKLTDTRFRGIFANLYGYLMKCFELNRYDSYRRKYRIAKSFCFSGNGIVFSGDGEIICKEESYIGDYSYIQTAKNTRVVIGRKCRIGSNLLAFTCVHPADEDFSKPELLSGVRGDVVIGDYCWIGSGVFIREGVEIGENSVIGANSVVTHNIPPHSIAAGSPAKVIKIKSFKHA